jgi:hypothetical protein
VPLETRYTMATSRRGPAPVTAQLVNDPANGGFEALFAAAHVQQHGAGRFRVEERLSHSEAEPTRYQIHGTKRQRTRSL